MPFTTTQQRTDLINGGHGSHNEQAIAAAGPTDWIEARGGVLVAFLGGATYSAEIERATRADKSDAVVVGTQDEDERAAIYDDPGFAYWRVDITALTAGPVTVIVSKQDR